MSLLCGGSAIYQDYMTGDGYSPADGDEIDPLLLEMGLHVFYR
jgi:hypothetical protein